MMKFIFSSYEEAEPGSPSRWPSTVSDSRFANLGSDCQNQMDDHDFSQAENDARL